MSERNTYGSPKKRHSRHEFRGKRNLKFPPRFDQYAAPRLEQFFPIPQPEPCFTIPQPEIPQPGPLFTIPHPEMPHMSNNWFWKNYYSVLNWQNKHKVAYWKSKAIALQYENDLLQQYIDSIITSNHSTNGPHIKYPNFKDYLPQALHNENNSSFSPNPLAFEGFEPEDNGRLECEDEECEEEEYKIEVSEEMKAFFKQSIKHKMEQTLTKKKEEEGIPSNYELYQQEIRTKQEFYGTGAPMIMGMETAMEVSFQRIQELKEVVMWPLVPIRI